MPYQIINVILHLNPNGIVNSKKQTTPQLTIMITRILGLDTGTNSLAWAVVDRDANGNYTLVKRGDVIFSEGVKIEKKKQQRIV